MRVIYAKRGDGLGTRMLSAVYARILADDLGCDMRLVWPRLGGVDIYDQYTLMHPDHLGDLFEGRYLFSDEVRGPRGEILRDGDTDGLSILSLYNNLGALRDLTREELLRTLRDHDGLYYDFPSPLLTFMSAADLRARRAELWAAVDWSAKLRAAAAHLSDAHALGDCPALHVRRGDIIDVIRRSSVDHLMADGMVQILQRYTPVAAFLGRLDALDHDRVIVCTEDAPTIALFRRRYGSGRVVCSADLGLSDNQRAALDMILLSRSKVIIAPVLSFFSQCAADLGGVPLINSAWHLRDATEELQGLLAGGDRSRTDQVLAILYGAAYRIAADFDPDLAAEFRSRAARLDPAVLARMTA